MIFINFFLLQTSFFPALLKEHSSFAISLPIFSQFNDTFIELELAFVPFHYSIPKEQAH
jgi:hypothetical protein